MAMPMAEMGAGVGDFGNFLSGRADAASKSLCYFFGETLRRKVCKTDTSSFKNAIPCAHTDPFAH